MPELMTWAEVPDLKRQHVDTLKRSAILPEVAARMGVRSANSFQGLIFPYRGRDGQVVNMRRPDDPGDGPKYRWPSDTPMVLSEIRDVEGDGPVILAEGTKQALAVASWAPAEFSVYGMNGCNGWSGGDLSWTAGRTVLVIMDADLRANREVYDAAARLAEVLDAEGAEVRHVLVPGVKKQGIDDLLGARQSDTRTRWIGTLCEKAVKKLPRAPRKESGSKYIDPDAGVLTDKLSRDVLEQAPAALTQEGTIAMYSGGVYVADGSEFTATVCDLLGDFFNVSYRRTVEEYAASLLYRDGQILQEHADYQMVNVRNGMLDLATGTLKPHDPAYLSTVQLPIEWDAEATCPRYLEWADSVGITDQLDDLEEVSSTMLDPTKTPAKAAFLYGPSRSGKSTYLRLLEAVAGSANRSAVTLQQLSENRFMAANVYRKVLNAAADLPATHVDDLSVFKMMTGADAVQADRKYGKQFTFTNRALFVFSANDPPTVSESSRAYAERIKPFRFGRSFAGRESQAVEDAIRAELPGIFVRLVKAWQRLNARGRYLETAPAVRQEFDTRSDRVREWVAKRCRVIRADPATGRAVSPDSTLPGSEMASKRDLARAFNAWAAENRTKEMSERKVIDRLTSINGVVEVRNKSTRARGLNIVPLMPGEDDLDTEEAERAERAVSTYPPHAIGAVGEVPEEVTQGHGKGGPKLPVLPAAPAPPAPVLGFAEADYDDMFVTADEF
jgi:putative DNA primase/helicase